MGSPVVHAAQYFVSSDGIRRYHLGKVQELSRSLWFISLVFPQHSQLIY